MKLIICAGAAGGLTAVILGALAAHGLEGILSASSLQSFKTAVSYQMYHSLALLLVAGLPQLKRSLAILAAWSFILGVLLFSGSIYLLTLAQLSWLGPVTPVGGLILMAGWILVLTAAIKGECNG
ncbi:DUF423 domain-containing protein [Salinimonas sp. HHU 13199]|uniref:DUF423 domain-containing protein n=1 Tax=Salinimonas profundi TaxID=2729140 RepID=A0ABR8LGX4_9ALTE|nr:DUF423 domain-containing protein [Salinimonas profundi]MBD3584962.1 DUF423 domain-containing protein [Salinimonas profundi]